MVRCALKLGALIFSYATSRASLEPGSLTTSPLYRTFVRITADPTEPAPLGKGAPCRADSVLQHQLHRDQRPV